MVKGERFTFGGVTHPLSEFYTPKNANSRERVTCVIDNCGASRGRRSDFIGHLKVKHPRIWRDFKKRVEEAKKDGETTGEEENIIKEEFERFISKDVQEVRFKFNTAMLPDLDKNQPRLTYIKLDGSLLNKKGSKIINRVARPIVDKSLDLEHQLTQDDFHNLPAGYQKGHMIPYIFFLHDEKKWKRIDTYSICAIQHGRLNDGLWGKLEEFAHTSTALGFVRVTVILQGDKKLENLKCRSVPPDYFYMILVLSDCDDKNWRCLAYRFPNEACNEGLNRFRTTIDTVRKETGFADLFSCAFPSSDLSVVEEDEVNEDLVCDESIPDTLYTSAFTPFDHIMFLERKVARLKAENEKLKRSSSF